MVDGRLAARVMRVAIENGGYVSSADARRLGLDRRILTRLVESGILVRLGHALYGLPGAGQRGQPCAGPCRLAHVAHYTGGAISHASAARIYGFNPQCLPGVREHLTMPRGLRRRVPPGIVLHRTTVFRPVDVRRHSGLLLTSPARTLVDLAGEREPLSDDCLVDLFDHLVAARSVVPSDVGRYLACTAHIPGVRRARRLLEPAIGGNKVDSAAERSLLRLVDDARLPAPETQFVLRTRDGAFVARLDAAWPARKLAVEVDGYRYHSGTKAFRHDRERATRIQLEGWTLYRTTPAEIRDGAPTLLAALRRALFAAGHN